MKYAWTALYSSGRSTDMAAGSKQLTQLWGKDRLVMKSCVEEIWRADDEAGSRGEGKLYS